MTPSIGPRQVGFTLAELRATALSRPRGQTSAVDPPPGPPPRPTTILRVVPAHSGAGASTVALALAESAAEHLGVVLVDGAAPAWSGLHNVEAQEGPLTQPWRGAARGRVRLLRLAGPLTGPDAVPDLPEGPSSELTVVDVGWSLRELEQAPRSWLAAPGDGDVLVTRAHLSGVLHAEGALRALAPEHRDRVQLGVIGTRRQAPLLRSAGGRCIRERCEADAMTWFPVLPHPPGELAPIGALPSGLHAAARQLLHRASRQAGVHTGPGDPVLVPNERHPAHATHPPNRSVR